MISVTIETAELAKDERFAFGQNWSRFVRLLSPQRISAAQESLGDMLQTPDLQSRTFLDIGSGSGLFSLAARRMGARVHSFDCDPGSVSCTQLLRDRYFPNDSNWTVEDGSILNTEYLKSLGTFDIVYAWGVLHHTGDLWRAVENAANLVAEEGTLFLALYNDQGKASRRWLKVKKGYLHLPRSLRPLLTAAAFVALHGPSIVKSTLRGRPSEFFHSPGRGMSLWRDMVDWVGGYPFEVSRPGEVFQFLYERGFNLIRMTTTYSLGCNEFVFRKVPCRAAKCRLQGGTD
jgi:2-polyprenyl-3-methyl-5-hydroxy-6-metoxy-1,4-benzoquinol methylase